MKPLPRSPVTVIRPSIDALPCYVAALRRGWSPDNVKGKAAADEQLRLIEADAPGFIESLDDPEAQGGPIILPDGSAIPRLPGFHRWIWDGEFCGSIGFRWQPDTSSLPAHVPGHIGYAIVPWKRRNGYATKALQLLLPEAWKQGLSSVDLTADPDNLPSQKVILSNGCQLIERFRKPDALGGGDGLRFRISLCGERG